jgi:cation diffusion facilitator CzcD-associated flavoprotein CzcO
MSEHTWTDPVLIIGAGAAGLATAAALKARGVPARVLEKEQRVGGTWRRRHPQLRLNTHRALSGLPGLAIPRAAGAFPGRDAVADYLEAYARYHHLHIEYGVEIRRIDPAESGWQVATSAGTQTGRHVIIATGRERTPFIPS